MITPRHIAIIMDGNGRWAKKRNHQRVYGHIRGAKVAYDIIKSCVELSVENLTLFAFSTENWKRPQHEVSLLMTLLIKYLKNEQKKLNKYNIRFHTIGNPRLLPKEVQELLIENIESTKNNTGMNLTFALNYGGRQEVIDSVKKIAEDIKHNRLDSSDINEQLINSYLQSAFMPDPELIIRTSNERRLSNFFLWQAAYSEFYFSDKLWPDFSPSDLTKAIVDFNSRNRRFGGLTEPQPPPQPMRNIHG